MMDTLQSNRDYSAQAEEAKKSEKYFDTDVDAARFRGGSDAFNQPK